MLRRARSQDRGPFPPGVSPRRSRESVYRDLERVYGAGIELQNRPPLSHGPPSSAPPTARQCPARSPSTVPQSARECPTDPPSGVPPPVNVPLWRSKTAGGGGEVGHWRAVLARAGPSPASLRASVGVGQSDGGTFLGGERLCPLCPSGTLTTHHVVAADRRGPTSGGFHVRPPYHHG